MRITKIIMLFMAATSFYHTARGQYYINEDNAQQVLETELSKKQFHLNLGVLKRCISFGADPNTVGRTGWTCLHECAMRNDTEFAKKLLAMGVHVDGTNQNNSTAYLIAASQHNKAMYDLLLPLTNPGEFDNKTNYSHLAARDFLDWKERLRITEEEDRLRNSSLFISKEIVIQRVLERVNRPNMMPLDGVLQSIIDNDTERFNKEIQHNTLDNYLTIDLKNASINVDQISLAAILGRREILKCLFAYQQNAKQLKNTSISMPIVHNQYSARELATDSATAELLDSLFDLDKQPSIEFEKPIPKHNIVYSNSIEISACVKNVKKVADVGVYLNNTQIGIIAERRSMPASDDPDSIWTNCDVTVRSSIMLKAGENVICIKAVNGRKSNSLCQVIEYRPVSDTTPGHKARRRAIVIGNSTENQLSNAPNDADSMRKALQFLCFDVTELIDIDLNVLKDTLDAFNQNLRDSDIFVIFYAGHGGIDAKKNFYISFPHANGIKTEYLNLDSLFDAMADKHLRNVVGILIADACRVDVTGDSYFASRGPAYSQHCRCFEASHRQIKEELYRNNLNRIGVLKAYSTSPGERAYDGYWRRGKKSTNSPYTTAVLKHLRSFDKTITEAFNKIQEDVGKLNISGQQTPGYQNQITGDFFLNPFQKED
jgi:ankyrin repeat protein